MQGEMKRGRSQVIWRYLPGATFRYNDDGAWCNVTDVSMQHIQALDGVLADALGSRLGYWNAIGNTGYPDPRTHPEKYVVGEPYWVRYDVWPTILFCTKCMRVYWWASVNKLRSTNDRLRCRSCGNTDDILKQVPYAFIHECGDINTLYVPQCSVDAQHPIGFENRRTFQDSYWYCQSCKTRLSKGPRAGLGVRACQCGKTMRGSTLIDPRVFNVQTIAIVNMEPEALALWKQNPAFDDFLFGASLRIPQHRDSDIQNLVRISPSNGQLSPELQKVYDLLIKQGMSEQKADTIVRDSARSVPGDPWTSYREQLAPCREYLSGIIARDSRQTVEFVFAREEQKAETMSITRLLEEAEAREDQVTAAQLREDKRLCESLGLINLAVIEQLPILLAGFGYSRQFGGPLGFDGMPNDTKLRPFKADADGKIPVFAARNTTEALLYELDPWRVAAFLQANGVVQVPSKAVASTHVLRAWLLSLSGKLRSEGQSHLDLFAFEIDRHDTVDLPSAMMFSLLHTISHMLMATANQYVGIDEDSLAEYLFPTHAAGLLYASSHVKFTLGGIDAVVRANLSQWIGSARDLSSSCSFDPVCSDSGGACPACLYTKFGCNYFNRSLSRAILFGGCVKGVEHAVVGFWSGEVAEITRMLQVQSDH